MSLGVAALGAVTGVSAAPTHRTPLVSRVPVSAVGYGAVLAAIGTSWLLDLVPTAAAHRVEIIVAVLFLAIGTPHGALDHLAVGARVRRPGLSDVAFVAGYVAVASAALLGYLVSPRVGFAAFLVLSVGHFAAGEAGVALDRGAGRRWWDPRPLTAAVAGALILLVPLSSSSATAAVAAVDPRLIPAVQALAAPAVVAWALLVVGVIVCTVLAMRGGQGARLVVVDAMALACLAALADPLLAFAAYYAGWHALRHQARLADEDGAWGASEAGRTRRPLLTVVRSAVPGLPATVGVIGVAVVLAVTGMSALGALLAVVWALTVPHAMSVAVLEIRRSRLRT